MKLLNWSGDTEKPENSDRDSERIEYTRERPKKRGPKPLPEHLEREDVFIDSPEDERICACCSKPMVRVGEVVTEELEITPPQFRVRRYVQGKWRCLDDMNRDRIEPLPPIAIPKSKLGKAVSYALDQWTTMLRYVDVGESEIDNNSCEHAIRPLKLGRNNFLFLGNLESGGERAEVFYSLAQTCRRLKINAFDYLKDVIERVARDPDRVRPSAQG